MLLWKNERDELTTEKEIRQWGNSVVIAIPAVIRDLLHIRAGEKAVMSVESDKDRILRIEIKEEGK